MSRDLPRPTSLRIVFLAGLVAALLFALYTNHVWEDYYITYRSSKNLATGHGLVFNHGEKLHTFTSPLGVLLPAAASLLTGNSSDTAALWIFRVMCAAALGGAAAVFLALARRLEFGRLVALAPIAALLTDAKSLDFTINGMETAFMLLFLAYALWAHFAPGPRQWLHLGAAWAGLMWTRPDSFIYIGLIAAGVWLFNQPQFTGGNRRQQIALFVRAGLLTTLLYGPWLAWAAWYYGTPIPHTITAKGGIGDARTVGGLIATALRLPWLAWFRSASLELTFLPSYYMIGGWPALMMTWSRALATVCALLWLVTRMPAWARAASFAYFGGHLYLTYFPYFPFPWYIPSTTLLALVALAGLLHWLAGLDRSWARITSLALCGLLLVGNLWMTAQVARQVRTQQMLIENGVRRPIGEWLRAHAAPGDAVFMEPLGYIGFFSGLKTYDWPGMSSPEVVAARREVGSRWGDILRHLQPRWVVLRPFEVARIDREAPRFLTDYYELVQSFDRTAELAAIEVPGRRYLEHDAHFVVFRLRPQLPNDPAHITLLCDGQAVPPSRRDLPSRAYFTRFNDHDVSVTLASATVEFPVPANLAEITGGLGLLDDAWVGNRKTGPVDFAITLVRTDGSTVTLLQRRLSPITTPEDRGFRSFRVPLPFPTAGRLRFSTTAVNSGTVRNLAFWGELEAVPLRNRLDFEGRAITASPASEAQFGLANVEVDGRTGLFAHAPTTLLYEWQEGMNRLEAGFGMLRGAHTEGHSTDGVVFIVEVEDADGARHELFRRHLDPSRQGSDQGLQSLAVAIPPVPGGRLILRTAPLPSGRLNYAWSYWTDLRVKR